MVEEFIIEFATINDMKAVFDLSNDELVRKNSFNQEEISWENHQTWYKNKLQDDNCLFFLIKNSSNNLISQVRFDKIASDKGIISISVSSKFRNKGYGVKILKLLSEKILKENAIKQIDAYIKKENVASTIIFEKAGYKLVEESQEKVRYEYS